MLQKRTFLVFLVPSSSSSSSSSTEILTSGHLSHSPPCFSSAAISSLSEERTSLQDWFSNTWKRKGNLKNTAFLYFVGNDWIWLPPTYPVCVEGSRGERRVWELETLIIHVPQQDPQQQELEGAGQDPVDQGAAPKNNLDFIREIAVSRILKNYRFEKASSPSRSRMSGNLQKH